MNVLLSMALLMWAAADTPVQVDVRLEPPVIPYHRQARYTIRVEAPADVPVELPDMLEQFGGVPVADVQRKTETAGRDRVRTLETYVLDPIFATQYLIYPATIKYGENETITVPSPALRVRDLTDEERQAAEEFVDIEGELSPPGVLARNWGWLVGGAALAAAVAGGIFVLFAMRKKREKGAPPIPPWEVAYQRLRELDARRLPQSGQYEPFYVDLSAILRYYIEDRFHLHAPEQTTQEFLSSASGSGVFTATQQQLLAGFLRHCDYVKFARYVPGIEEMEQSFATVLRFIDDTVPQPEPQPGETAIEEPAA